MTAYAMLYKLELIGYHVRLSNILYLYNCTNLLNYINWHAVQYQAQDAVSLMAISGSICSPVHLVFVK